MNGDLAGSLEALRSRRKMTQKEMAEFIGVPWRTYRNWEKGLRHPTFDNIQRLLTVIKAKELRISGR